jgi:hypothetical protein
MQSVAAMLTWASIKEQGQHLWLGTKLMWLQMKTASGLLFKSLRGCFVSYSFRRLHIKVPLIGKSLSRREKRLLVRTAADMFRLIPFSFFVIVPLAEFSLPFFLKLFPNMLPSTFASKDAEEMKLYKTVKARLEMAKFLLEISESLKSQTSKFDTNFKETVDGVILIFPCQLYLLPVLILLITSVENWAASLKGSSLQLCKDVQRRSYSGQHQAIANSSDVQVLTLFLLPSGLAFSLFLNCSLSQIYWNTADWSHGFPARPTVTSY